MDTNGGDSVRLSLPRGYLFNEVFDLNRQVQSPGKRQSTAALQDVAVIPRRYVALRLGVRRCSVAFRCSRRKLSTFVTVSTCTKRLLRQGRAFKLA
jgi:hypothetical protein